MLRLSKRKTMTSISELLADLTGRSVELWFEGDTLRFRAPKGALREDDRALLMGQKSEVIRLLKQRALSEIEAFPLAYSQRALWLINQTVPESAAYNIAFTARIHSYVDVQALRLSVQALIDRHSALRTTYTVSNGEPVQQIHGHVDCQFEQMNASQWSHDELMSKVIESYKRPFDLGKGPLLRTNLFSHSAQDHILLITIHHIAADGWSIFLLLSELRMFYSAQITNSTVSLPRPKVNYSEFVSWQNEMISGPEGERLWSYWRKQLSGQLPVLNLTIDKPRPPVQTYRGASYSFKASEDLTKRLKAFAREEETTLYTVILAAFQALLYRYTAQEDILVGSPTYGRSRPNFSGIVGDFINMIVLRANLSGNPTFRTFLGRMRQVVLEALDHQDYPFPLLVERLRPVRDPSRSPIYQVLFALQKFEQFHALEKFMIIGNSNDKFDFGGLELQPFVIPQQEGQLDLSLEMAEAASSLFGTVKYNTDLFGAETISRLIDHFKTLLGSAVTDPTQRLSELSLLTKTERHQLLAEWNDTDADYPRDKCIHELFEAQAGRTPDAVAVVFEAKRLTYGELNRRANQVAHYLKSLGVGPETLVCICVERSPEMLVGLLGILKAGAGYVPLDPAYPKERLAFMLKDTHAPLLLTQEHLVKMLPISGAKVVCLDGDIEIIAAQSEENPMSGAAANNIAYAIYTSGSTGTPKGVMIEHESVVNLISWHNRTYGVTPADKTTQIAGLSFDASVWEIWPYLTAGASVYIPDEETRLSPSRLVEWLAGQAISICFLPTPVAEAVLEEKLPRNLTLRTLLTGGDKLRRSPKKALPFSLINNYGPTENTVVTTWTPVGTDTETDSAPAIGHPVDNTQCYVLDAHLQPVPIGVAGELHIGGVGLARGYLNRPELTAEKFIPNPFSEEPGARLYKTGDLVRYLPDGNLEFLGRIDHQVKIRGFRIELGEIETVLGQHPSVRDVVVLAREDSPGEKRLVAYLVVEEEPGPTTAELRSFLKEKLPDYMVPSAFVVLEAFPLTPNGKVDRKALPKPDVEKFTEKHYVGPETELERAITAIWQQVLKL
jgi:amino acid adenylation domain-containing protein